MHYMASEVPSRVVMRPTPHVRRKSPSGRNWRGRRCTAANENKNTRSDAIVSHSRNTAIDDKEKKMNNRLSRQAVVFCLLATGLIVLVARTALALSNISLKLGT